MNSSGKSCKENAAAHSQDYEILVLGLGRKHSDLLYKNIGICPVAARKGSFKKLGALIEPCKKAGIYLAEKIFERILT